jgi:hypothetical protein
MLGQLELQSVGQALIVQYGLGWKLEDALMEPAGWEAWVMSYWGVERPRWVKGHRLPLQSLVIVVYESF